MRFEISYTSSNVNHTPNAVDWGRNGLVCYASCNSVMIYDPDYGSGGKVIGHFVGPAKRVNSVRWLRGRDVSAEDELVAGSSDSTVTVWSLDGRKSVLRGHTCTVTAIDGLYKGENRNSAVIASVSPDNTVKIWCRLTPEDEFTLHQNLRLEYNIATCLRLSQLPNIDLLLLGFAMSNSHIYLYIENGQLPMTFDDGSKLVGHEDWVQGLDFKQFGDDLMLASCSQDSTLHLWRITKRLLLPKRPIALKEYNVYSESVLTGHDNWVFSIHWSPTAPQLLSASTDKSLIIWEKEDESSVWMETIRVGEVGGNTLGFYGGIFSPAGDRILAYSYHGAFHIWRREESGRWRPCVTVGGHFDEVVDCAWEPDGEFLVSCSADQTTRVHAPWRSGDKEITWHEIARPQVHGYDLHALAMISRYKFCSAADEKIARAFSAPVNFIENFRSICRISNDKEGDEIIESQQSMPKGASIPSLGLSNKAVYKEDNIEDATVDDRYAFPEESHFTATHLTEPPTEETLLQNTLWPETKKFYGHGYEVFSLAVSPDGRFFASACKSARPEHAGILIKDTSTWDTVQWLRSHKLTVVQMEFSPDSRYLLSVSRDRTWSLFSRRPDDTFELCASTADRRVQDAVHSRIIWTCSWSHDSRFFATGSRDGRVAVWGINNEVPSILDFDNVPVTAVTFAPDLIKGDYLIAIGFDTGIIKLYLWKRLGEAIKVLELSQNDVHHSTVKRLRFRPKFGRAGVPNDDRSVLQLASCSCDYSLKIIDIYVDR